MKRSIVIAVFGIVLLAAGCSKIKNLANINVDIPYNTQVSVPDVPGYTVGIPLPLGGIDMPSVTVGFATDSKTYLAQYGTAANLVTSVYLKSMAVQIASPPGQNFDFLDNIQVYMSAKGLPEVLVVSQNSIPKGIATLNLTTNTDVNLKSYFVQDTIYMRLGGHINAVPVAGEELNISSVFHVVANPLN